MLRPRVHCCKRSLPHGLESHGNSISHCVSSAHRLIEEASMLGRGALFALRAPKLKSLPKATIQGGTAMMASRCDRSIERLTISMMVAAALSVTAVGCTGGEENDNGNEVTSTN